jgi:thiol-disulfide isomerase/thioredoxin
MNRRLALMSIAWPSVPGAALAAPVRPAVPELRGRTLDGTPFSLAEQRGKVVLLLLWSTSCAVCRDVLPELRANYAGWRGKPFEIVAVSIDKRRADVEDYRRLLETMVARGERFPMLWRGEAGHADNLGTPARLPASWVIDSKGNAAEQFLGRLPAEAWDRIADLMP